MGDVTDPQSPPPLVILVHGTFAGIAAPEGQPQRWWQEGSVFRSALSDACGGMEVTQFCWGDGGANSETVRRASADKLLAVLRTLEQARRPYHLVGHSHGGSVIWQALVRSCSDKGADKGADEPELRHLRSWTTVGTPFQDFAPAHIELAGAGVVAAACLAWFGMCLYAWVPLIVHGEQGWLVFHHAIGSQVRALQEKWPFASPGAEFVRFLLCLFDIIVLMVIALIVGRQLLPFSEDAPEHSDPDDSPAPSVAMALTVASACLLAAGGLWVLAGSAIDMLTLVFATLLSLPMAYYASRISWKVMRGWWIIRQRSGEKPAATLYGHLWRAIYHPDDEAIAALRCALFPAPAIMPRKPRVSRKHPPRLVQGRPTVIQLIVDQFVWETAMTRLQGDDLDGGHVRRSGLAPRALKESLTPAARVLQTGVERDANEKGAVLFRQLRTWLSVAAKGSSIEEAARRLTHTLTFEAVIHNAYFFEEGPLDEDGLRPQGARAEVLDLISGFILAPCSEDTAGRAHAPSRTVTARRRRHVLLHATRAGAAVSACIAVFASCYFGYRSLVLPLENDEQYASLTELPSQKGALATSDGPVVGAFLARLAAGGPVVQANLISAVMEPNARAVVAQRLAFQAGLHGLGALALPPRPGLKDEVSKRLQDLAELSWLAGRVAGGHDIAKFAGKVPDLWSDLGCKHTDADAAAGMAVQVVAAGLGAEAAGNLARKAAAQRAGRCETVDAAEPGPSARGLLTDAAYGLLTWDEVRDEDVGKRKLRLQAAASLLAAPVGGVPAIDGLEVDLLQSRDQCSFAAKEAVSILKEAVGSGTCSSEANRMAGTILKALDEGALSRISEGPLGPGVSAIRTECKDQPMVLSNRLPLKITETFDACRGALDAARRIVSATAVQLASGAEPRHAAAVSKLVDNLEHTATTYGDGLLWPIVDVYRRAMPPGVDPAQAAAAVREPLASLAKRIALAQNRMASGCGMDQAGKVAEPPCAGLARLDFVWTAVSMLDVVAPKEKTDLLVHAGESLPHVCGDLHKTDRQRESGPLLQYAKAVDIAIGGGGMSSEAVHELSRLRDRTVDVLLCDEGHEGDEGHKGQGKVPPCPPALDGWSPDQMLTLAQVARSRSPLLDRVRKCIQARIDSETSATRRASLFQNLAQSHLLDRDLFGARTTALAAGAVNYVLAGLCPILEERIAGPGGKVREGNWPQPVPVTFGALPRFSYDNDRPQPLQCRGWRTFDLE